jgi:hypothetical protein
MSEATDPSVNKDLCQDARAWILTGILSERSVKLDCGSSRFLAQLGRKTVNITGAALCDSNFMTGSISFSFHHEEAGRNIVDSLATGQARRLHVENV